MGRAWEGGDLKMAMAEAHCWVVVLLGVKLISANGCGCYEYSSLVVGWWPAVPHHCTPYTSGLEVLVGGECSRLGYWAVTSLGVSSSLDGMGGRPWMCGMGWPKLLTVSSLAEMPDSGPDWRVCMSLRTPQCL